MEIALLRPLVIIFGISAVVVFLLGRMRMPSIIGFILAGFIAGPFGLNLITDIHAIEIFAEIGIILLMFTLGLEFSISELLAMKREVFGAGFLQVGLTILATLLFGLLFHYQVNEAVFYGFLLAMSSTAIALKLLMERSEASSPHGRYVVGILLFQDIAVVPLMLIIPMLSQGDSQVINLLTTILKAFGLLGLIFIAARWIIPLLLREIVKIRSRELFIIIILLLCISTALFTSSIGLSLALGSFLAGIIISESEYSAQAISDILPFKESFIALFFISIGMLIDFHFLMNHLALMSLVIIVIIIIKAIVVFFTTILLSSHITVAIKSMLYLFQIGEFSFVLATAGRKFQIISDDTYQIFLMSAIATMLMTPVLVRFSEQLSHGLIRLCPKLSTKFINKKAMVDDKNNGFMLNEHVIIIGFGINGMNLAKTLKDSSIPYCVLEMNPKTVEKYKKLDEPIYYGDGTSIEILHKLGIKKAKMLVIVISDPAAIRRIVQIARHENPNIYILVRTRYLAEVDDLIKLGANEVIPEEFETSIEIFARVLTHYNVPRNLIIKYVDNIRQNNYGMLRNKNQTLLPLGQRKDFLKSIDTEIYMITEKSIAKNKSIRELELRKQTGVTIIAIQRDQDIIQNPHPDYVLQLGDVLLLIGSKEHVCNAMSYLEGEECPLGGL
jgi:CPA2 family monovalent cation:H+ antiporter-2